MRLDTLEPARESLQVRMSPGRVVGALVTIFAVLCTAQIAALYVVHVRGDDQWRELVRLVRFGAESNLPTYFNAGMLLGCALLFACVGLQTGVPVHARRGYWLGLAAGFLFLSVDDVSMVHEMVGDYLDTRIDTTGFLTFSWVIPATVGVIVIALVYRRFLRQLPRRTGTQVMIACTLFLGGAIGMEIVGGAYGTRHGFANLTFDTILTLKKGMEMAGLVMLFYALLSYIDRYYDAVLQLEFSEGSPRRSAATANPRAIRRTKR